MKKRMAVLSIFYALGQISQGLLFHPYQTMQSLVRDKFFIWMSFLPVAILILATFFWRLLVLPIIFISLPAVLIYWFIFFCFYWQCLLLYLLVRFFTAFRF
jgi:hypothetical protein